ncbi:hypothetical protein I8748_14980 [Nostoc sp. CENA67]|uniref:Uncharacterized protein n=1 Tax=Amazonocrinis nigriterrae CENA67 TaxID=2794033 RepID=A0A8J7HPF6_9NOST|nr:hypothetical protein [Amazonocrinis nigriterrae]MBH8563473.1 hypothetical protein [Amazonocrinis nigriterrae CENA67]
MTDKYSQIWRTVKKCFSLALVLFISVALSVTAPDTALAEDFGDLVFYEGNDCKQDIVFTYNSEASADDNCQTSGTGCYGDNDEARSLLITGFANPGTRIKVFDSTSADTTDDYTVIDILPDLPLEGTCVGTFEQTQQRSGYKVAHVHKDGLDGQVSHVTVQP